MARSRVLLFGLLGPLMLAAGGCSHVLAVQGYSTGEPAAQFDQGIAAKHWSSDSLHTGFEIQDWLGKACDADMAAWCDANGNWGITNQINNRADAHLFRTDMEFGHIDHHDFKTFTVIAVHSTPATVVKTHEDKLSSASGSTDSAIQAGFEQINAIRPTLTMQDGFVWPISFQNFARCTSLPGDQGYEGYAGDAGGSR